MKSFVPATLVVGAALVLVATRPAAAQNPTPGQAQQLLQQAQQNPALAEQLRQRLQQSGLTPTKSAPACGRAAIPIPCSMPTSAREARGAARSARRGRSSWLRSAPSACHRLSWRRDSLRWTPV